MSQPPNYPQGNPNQNWQGQPQQGGYPQQAFNPQGGYQQQPAPKKKGGCMKIGLIVLGVIIVLGIIIGVAGGGDDSGDSSSAGGSGQDSAQDSGAVDSGIDFNGKTDDDLGANAGETISQNDLAITTTPLETRQSQYSPTQLCTTITIENNSDQQQSFNMFDWQMQDPNGASQSGMPPFDSSGSGLSSGEIAPGGQTTGDICFEGDPATMPGEYVVLYQGNIFVSDRLGWVNQL